MNYNISLTEKIMPIDGIYQGDLVEGDRVLIDIETSLYVRGYGYQIENHELVDITQTPEYIAKELEKTRQEKLTENQQKRDSRLFAGVVYKDVLFDSDQDQKINLMAIASNMSDTIIWFGKDGVTSLSCTKNDIEKIGSLITNLTQNIWGNLNPSNINKINTATTIEELNAINIEY